MQLIGVDEAGRGPLAGPVAVGAVLLALDFEWARIVGVHDSKQLSETKREELYRIARDLKRAGQLDFQVSLVSAGVIDRIGIAPAVRRGVARSVHALTARHSLAPADVMVKLDGALRAPERFTAQETIIGGDGREQCIGLASILAKVTRDQYMCRAAQRYPEYNFHIHKGYGTTAHREHIMHHGLSELHRQTFCSRLIT